MKTLLIILLTITLSSASVKIYKNKVELSYTPSSKFVGFNKNIDASNSDGSIGVLEDSCENLDTPTCRDINKLDKLTQQNTTLKKQKTVMNKLLDNFYSDYKDVKTNMEYISQMSESISKLDKKIKLNKIEISKLRQKLKLPTYSPYFLDKLYKDEIKLTFNGVHFYSAYILDIDKGMLKQTLCFTNSSGIDISKTTAHIFERNFYATTPNRAFRPSTVSKVRNRVYKKAKVVESAMPVMSAMMMDKSYKKQNRVKRLDTKSYKISNFSLKADGLEKKFVIDSKKVKVKKETIWRAWQSGVFVQGSFDLLDTLQSKKIDIIYKNSLSKNNFVRAENNKHIFNIEQDYDIKVKRKTVPTYTQSKGLFNSDTMTKTTIKLQLSNSSNKTKKLDIYEKIPISTDEDIVVELDYFKDKNNKNVKYSFNKKNGKITLHVVLKPKEHKEFTYEYSIRHPKDINIYISK
jgi:hypothetical protein